MYSEFTKLTLDQAMRYCEGSERQRVRDVIAAKVGPHRTVLDLCCGPGIDAPRYSSAKYTGVDISEVLVAAARKLNPGYNFVVGDCTDLSSFLGKDWAECVMVKSALEHVPSEEIAVAILHEAVRLARYEVFVAWHTPPRADVLQSEVCKVPGHFGLTVNQNQYAMAPFLPFRENAKVEVVDNFQLWTIRK